VAQEPVLFPGTIRGKSSADDTYENTCHIIAPTKHHYSFRKILLLGTTLTNPLALKKSQTLLNWHVLMTSFLNCLMVTTLCMKELASNYLEGRCK
jgi:hypothetical protein